MNENIVAFLKKLTEDTELQEKMNGVTNPDEAYALASSVQEGFTKEEFVEAMQKIKEALENNDEVSEDELGATAGGLDWEKVGMGALYTVGGVVAVGGAFSAIMFAA